MIIKKTLSIVLIVIILLIIIPIIVWKYNSIGKAISEGEGYGFVIGESKISTIQRVIDDAKRYNYKAIQVGNGAGDFKIVDIDSLQFDSIEKYDRWVILVDDTDSFLNIIRLNFEDKNLIRIYRHKKLFEFP